MIKMYFEDVERGFRLAWHKTPTLFESNNTRQYLVDLFDCLEIDNKGLIVWIQENGECEFVVLVDMVSLSFCAAAELLKNSY